MNDGKFEWDDAKAASHIRKHGVSFAAATAVFDDPAALYGDDLDSSADEDRFVVIGHSAARLLIVNFTCRGDRVRIISARPASRHQEHGYYNR